MNLAGAEVVLRLTNRIQDLEHQVQRLVIEIERLRAEQERPALREGTPE